MSISRTIRSGALLLAALSACSPAPAGHSPAAPQTVTVDVAPRSAQLQVGGNARFAATVTGTADTSVTWEVVEPGGGAVGADGLYVAPATPGTFHVRATSRAAPEARAESTVTVVAAPAISVTVSPRTATVVPGGSVLFSATVLNATNTAVAWSVAETGCGTITAAGVYTAPAAPAVCTIVAASQADPSRTDRATVTVATAPQVIVTVTPSPAAADACTTVTFTASVTGAADASVTWSVQEGLAGGTIDAAGVYVAPSTAGTYHVVATSRADPARSATVPVAVTDRVLGVAVSPQTVQVAPGGTAQFTATITTTCGSYTSTSTVNSAGQIVAKRQAGDVPLTARRAGVATR